MLEDAAGNGGGEGEYGLGGVERDDSNEERNSEKEDEEAEMEDEEFGPLGGVDFGSSVDLGEERVEAETVEEQTPVERDD